MKHWDFILLDIFCLQLSSLLSFILLRGWQNPFVIPAYQQQAVLLFIAQLLTILFTYNYGGILRRKRFDELVAIVRYMLIIFLIILVYLFIVHQSSNASRLQLGWTSVGFILFDFIARLTHKQTIFRRSNKIENQRAVVVFTSSKLAREAIDKLKEPGTYQDYFITALVCIDDDPIDLSDLDVRVTTLSDEVMQKITHGWVDEAFILQPDDMSFPTDLMEALMEMGITVNFSVPALNDRRWPVTDMRKLGGYKVLTSSLRFASAGELFVKRLIDILGGIVGCLITGILYLFIAPAIYRKSPGPIFFAQDRVGQNGKVFKFYKFRSMYLDAEERKAALMEQNKVKDGMMFKIDDDPRIIGSEKKDKNGKPKGIGNFIRNTSLDEFPQFYNVLRGDMSLVGTRPPTLDEWKKYEYSHRARMSIKPGITGMWQVSGRSEITDFDEIVKLDKEYIEEWSLWLDIKILIKTVFVVLKRKGAS
ncbi:MAG: sugar transferase [Lachnospiraceae bacterium]|nr:sugar transferase [Lachnospiraceae bacterium]